MKGLTDFGAGVAASGLPFDRPPSERFAVRGAAFVLGPLMEENLRRAMVLARGDATVVLTRPISAGLIAAAALPLVLAVPPMIRKRRDEVFVE